GFVRLFFSGESHGDKVRLRVRSYAFVRGVKNGLAKFGGGFAEFFRVKWLSERCRLPPLPLLRQKHFGAQAGPLLQGRRGRSRSGCDVCEDFGEVAKATPARAVGMQGVHHRSNVATIPLAREQAGFLLSSVENTPDFRFPQVPD